jgi:hypothetical protein
MFSPLQGRFLSMDPRSPDGVDILYDNPFAYARNNPANLTDPSGRGPDDVANPEINRHALRRIAPGQCRIGTHCWTVRRPDYDFGRSVGTHCGLTVYQGDTKFHWIDGLPMQVGSTTCVQFTRPLFIPDVKEPSGEMLRATEMGPWFYTDADCDCVLNYYSTFNKAPCTPYYALFCNSNWALKCMIERCNLHITWKNDKKPEGYDCDQLYKDQSCNTWKRAPNACP